MYGNRYVGDYPVIGIRPTIDGRRGALKVRESQEEQTMGMAASPSRSSSTKRRSAACRKRPPAPISSGRSARSKRRYMAMSSFIASRAARFKR